MTADDEDAVGGQYVVGEDIAFELGGADHHAEGAFNPDKEPESASKKKRNKKKKKKSSHPQVETPESPGAHVTMHSDGHGLTIDNIQATSREEIVNAASAAVARLQPQYESVANSLQTSIWDTTASDERTLVRDFWLSLTDDERLDLVKLDKDILLQKVRRQRPACSCSVCGRKHQAVERELEELYDAYYTELKLYSGPGESPAKFPPRSLSGILTFEQPPKDPLPAPPVDRVKRATIQYPVAGQENGYMTEDEEEYFDDDYEPGAGSPAASLSSYAGGILSVADDLLKNDGRRFVDVMEHLAEQRLARGPVPFKPNHSPTTKAVISELDELIPELEAPNEPSADNEHSHDHDHKHSHDHPHDHSHESHDQSHDKSHTHTHSHSSHTDSHEWASDEEYYDHDADAVFATYDEQLQQKRSLIKGFAARMFQQRVLNAYRENVARERQLKLLAEIDEETKAQELKEQKKLKDKEKKKDKKRQQKLQKEQERAKKEEEQRNKEEASRRKQEEARNAQLEQERIKAETRRLEIEARMKKMQLATAEREAKELAEKEKAKLAEAAAEAAEASKPKPAPSPVKAAAPSTAQPKASSRPASISPIQRPPSATPQRVANGLDRLQDDSPQLQRPVPIRPIPQSTTPVATQTHFASRLQQQVGGAQHGQESPGYQSFLLQGTAAQTPRGSMLESPEPRRASLLQNWGDWSSSQSPLGFNQAPQQSYSPYPQAAQFAQRPSLGQLGQLGQLHMNTGSSQSLASGASPSQSAQAQNPASRLYGFAPSTWGQPAAAAPAAAPTLWSQNSMWSTTVSLETIRNMAINSYDRLLNEGFAVDGYVPSQVLFHATADTLGPGQISQNDLYRACGVAGDSEPEYFECLRDNVGLVTHMRYIQ